VKTFLTPPIIIPPPFGPTTTTITITTTAPKNDFLLHIPNQNPNRIYVQNTNE
jgi:hypothetical protein